MLGSSLKRLFGESVEGWKEHNGTRLGASLAFYSLLSLTPLMLVAVSIGGLAFGQKAAESRLVAQIQDLTGPQGANAIYALLQGTRNTTHGIFATIAGIVTLFFGASGVIFFLGAEFTRCLTRRRESSAGKLPRDVRSAA